MSRMYKEEKEKVERLWCAIFGDEKEVIVLIELERSEDEQKIFDTINSSGLKLSVSDIVKNALYQRLMSFNNNKEEAIKFYEKTWEHVFEDDEEKKEYWTLEKKRNSGHLNIQNIEIFLFCFAVVKDFFSHKRGDVLSKLTKCYKAALEKLNSKAECKEFINELVAYAKIYKKNFPILSEENNLNFEDYKMRLFKILDSQGITSYHPYILYLFEKHQDDESELKTALCEVERFIVKTTIIGDTNSSGLNCEDFVKNEDRTHIRQKSLDIKNSQIRETLKTGVSNKLGKMLLFWIELHRRDKTGKYDESCLDYKYQLEHIMPIEWMEYWQDVPYVDENGTEIEETAEAVQKREEMITSLGNMTLLKKALNKEIRNYDFRRKVEGDGKREGMKAYASLSITNDDLIKNVYEKGKEWNEEAISKRAERLCNEIIEIWG